MAFSTAAFFNPCHTFPQASLPHFPGASKDYHCKNCGTNLKHTVLGSLTHCPVSNLAKVKFVNYLGRTIPRVFFFFFLQEYFYFPPSASVTVILTGGGTFYWPLQSNFVSCCWGNVSSIFLHWGWKASEWRPGQFPIDPILCYGMEWGGRIDLRKPLAQCLQKSGCQFSDSARHCGQGQGCSVKSIHFN